MHVVAAARLQNPSSYQAALQTFTLSPSLAWIVDAQVASEPSALTLNLAELEGPTSWLPRTG
jgi:hypothetical protein